MVRLFFFLAASAAFFLARREAGEVDREPVRLSGLVDRMAMRGAISS